ncbi:unnamed protein product [Spirodela intermedia]|uniref:Uncharacterized protein n=1 Tax=Spirodela intermedia TaxID=51605 RepID=A0ABN7EAT1_SPIIN|nr:unnamed protein product [Spirodela intermedia]
MGRQIISGSYHPAKQKNGDFAALRRLSPDEEELDGVAHTCLHRFKLLEPLLAATLHLRFRPACRPGWPAGPPIL